MKPQTFIIFRTHVILESGLNFRWQYTLFHNTRNEFCANYRIPNLNVPQNVVRELETLYGFQKQHIFQHRNSKDVMQHVTLAHQILKTIIACNAINTEQETVDVTPQDVKKVLKKAQKALTD